MDRLVLWDFDGTLGERCGGWTSCLMDVLDEHQPGHGLTAGDIRPHLRSGFPWHAHATPHPELCQPEVWWGTVEALLAKALANTGLTEERSRYLMKFTRESFLDARHWRLYDDASQTLDFLAGQGWSHAVISNHVPELSRVIEGLGITNRLEAVFSSALTGYEKPRAEAFRIAIESLGNPSHVWMVGDNPIADVAGAEKVGIPAILVGTDVTDEGYRRRLEDTWGGDGWEDWLSLVTKTAPNLSSAAQIILGS